MSASIPQEPAREAGSTQDGAGTSDHDESYRFGRRPTAQTPFPFSPRQYARLLILRGRVHDSVLASAAADVEGPNDADWPIAA